MRVAAVILLVGVAGFAAPETVAPRSQVAAATLDLVVAETPAQHRQMAMDYRRQAAAYRLDAQMHRQLRDTYRQGVSAKTRDRRKAWWSQARVHCDRMIVEAEKLSREADAMVALHEEQAREIEAGPDAPPGAGRER